MRKFLFLLALIATPAHALDKCGPNYELPNDLTPAEIQSMEGSRQDRIREEQLRIENNKKRDSSITDEGTLKLLHEFDRSRMAYQQKLTDMGIPDVEVLALCMIRAGNGDSVNDVITRSIIRSKVRLILMGHYSF